MTAATKSIKLRERGAIGESTAVIKIVIDRTACLVIWNLGVLGFILTNVDKYIHVCV